MARCADGRCTRIVAGKSGGFYQPCWKKKSIVRDWGERMLDFASVCVRGAKQENHDYIGILEEYYCACFAVSDGKNTPDSSEIAVKTILEDFKHQSEITTATMPHFFAHAQQVLEEAQAKEALPEGCAAAVLLTDGELAVWAHIGDCRIYHLQDQLLYEITPDHSEAYYRYEAGDIRYPKIRTDRKRWELTHLMGLGQSFEPTFAPPTVVRKNDSFLVCTDGFWENIHERQIEKTLKRAKTAQVWLDRMLKIVKRNRAGGKYTKTLDDYSAIAIKL